MSKERVITDRRLLAALDYIDQKYIDDVFSIIKEPSADTAEPVRTWRTPFKHWKQIVALAACLILLSAASPLANFISQAVSNFRAGAGSGTTESSEILNTESIETTNLIEETSPFFWMYTPELESLTQEQVDECNQAWRLKVCGTLEDYIASYPEGKEQKAEKDYYETMFISTEKSRPYLGTFNGAIVSAGILDSMEETIIKVAGYVISFPTSAGISAYKDGEICSIKTAYEKGWLTDDNIRVISERVKKYYKELYR